jgi:hypothetical protein
MEPEQSGPNRCESKLSVCASNYDKFIIINIIKTF